MGCWRAAWQVIQQRLPTKGLLCLRTALETDDSALLQGASTNPPPWDCVSDWSLSGGCPIVYAGWRAGLFSTVGEGEIYFAQLASRLDRELGWPSACFTFLNFWDDGRREEVRALLLEEVTQEIQNRLPSYLRSLNAHA